MEITTLPFPYPITRNQIAEKYGVCAKTIGRWLREIGIEHQKTLSPAECGAFVRAYGMPVRKMDYYPGMQIALFS